MKRSARRRSGKASAGQWESHEGPVPQRGAEPSLHRSRRDRGSRSRGREEACVVPDSARRTRRAAGTSRSAPPRNRWRRPPGDDSGRKSANSTREACGRGVGTSTWSTGRPGSRARAARHGSAAHPRLGSRDAFPGSGHRGSVPKETPERAEKGQESRMHRRCRLIEAGETINIVNPDRVFGSHRDRVAGKRRGDRAPPPTVEARAGLLLSAHRVCTRARDRRACIRRRAGREPPHRWP